MLRAIAVLLLLTVSLSACLFDPSLLPNTSNNETAVVRAYLFSSYKQIYEMAETGCGEKKPKPISQECGDNLCLSSEISFQCD